MKSYLTNRNLYFFSVPPGRPVIYNERGIIVETNLGPYNEGVELILTCSVSGGKSIPTFQFQAKIDWDFYNFGLQSRYILPKSALNWMPKRDLRENMSKWHGNIDELRRDGRPVPDFNFA